MSEYYFIKFYRLCNPYTDFPSLMSNWPSKQCRKNIKFVYTLHELKLVVATRYMPPDLLHTSPKKLKVFVADNE